MSVFALPSLPSDRRRRQRRWRSAASSFTYGNSLIHSQTLNSRGLPSRIRDRSGSTSRLDYSYAYDKHGNLTSIVDGVNANENRSLQYDARDRLTVATAANIYGEEIYDYDILDNVRRLGANSILPSPVSVDGGIPAYVIPNESLQGLKPQILDTMDLPNR